MMRPGEAWGTRRTKGGAGASSGPWVGRGRDWVEGRELDGGRVRAAEAQRREERRGRAHGDAATNSRLVNDVIPQGKTRFAATITGSTTHDDDEYRRVAARALLATRLQE